MDTNYFSHVALLAAAFNRTTGPVIELGAGYGSTLMLHGLCGSTGRTLLTVESNKPWFGQFTPHYIKDWHEFVLVDDYRNLPEYDREWGLAFVDHGIAEQRGESIRQLAHVPVIIAHDTNNPDLYGYEVLNDFTYRYDWKARGKALTSMVSNTVDVVAVFGGMGL